MAQASHHQPRQPRREALLGAGSAVALHALAAWLLLHQPPTVPLQAPRILEVSLLAAPAPVAASVPAAPAEPVKAPDPPPPPTPKPVERRPAKPRPAVVKPAPPKPTDERPAPSNPAPTGAAASPAPAAPATAAAQTAASAGEPALTAPRFDAAYLNNPPPTYPPLSRRLGEQGRVLVRVFVDPSGAPAQVELRESSGHRRLDDAAAAAVRRWRFVPARRGDEPVGAWVLVPISFNLRS
ncbi:energy transducer TonB [Immundisolibacter sp.]|uniref:energy transducer TonB n=1 Tax=Immundisolibacter sp. TaxID=1934948 RepID=UPI00261ED90C|nr:energy transducer TonB [Immundisolibacter sp.]MDD3650540.1 energy transducer TonB [Immundisolibacter sp.]